MKGFTKSDNAAFDAAREQYGAIDTMIGFPAPREEQAKHYDFIRAQTHDSDSQEWEFPAQYMFKGVPHYDRVDDPVDMLVAKMDEHGIAKAITGLPIEGNPKIALERYPDRFFSSCGVDPNTGMDSVRALDTAVKVHGAKATQCWGTGLIPQVPLNDKKMYPIYAKCVELGIPVFCCAGVPGPRLRFEPQKVEYIDEVMYDFPELVFVTRHGCEPWQDLAVKLMLKWPGLHYSTSAFAPKHYPKAIIDYANTRGADKIIYAGYFPMGLSIERIMTEMPNVGFKDQVWPKFLRENAMRVLGLDS
jgi:uncharacterized protein